MPVRLPSSPAATGRDARRRATLARTTRATTAAPPPGPSLLTGRDVAGAAALGGWTARDSLRTSFPGEAHSGVRRARRNRARGRALGLTGVGLARARVAAFVRYRRHRIASIYGHRRSVAVGARRRGVRQPAGVSRVGQPAGVTGGAAGGHIVDDCAVPHDASQTG